MLAQPRGGGCGSSQLDQDLEILLILGGRASNQLLGEYTSYQEGYIFASTRRLTEAYFKVTSLQVSQTAVKG